MKKTLLLTLLMSDMLSGAAFAEPVLVDGIYYELLNGKAVVTNNGDPFSSYPEPYVSIPPVVEYQGQAYAVEDIADGAFCMSEVMEVSLPMTLRTIGNEAFRDCGRLAYISLPESLSVIGNDAFRNCWSLTVDKLPSALYMLGENAFVLCRLPETLVIPASLDHIGPGAFFETPVKSFEVEPNNASYSSEDGILCSKDTKTLVAMPPATDLETYTVPSGFSEIASHAFAGCGLKKIVVPDNVTVIGSYAFRDCDSLTDISLPSTLTAFPPYMLSSCGSLKSLEIPEGVEELGVYSLSWCDSLSEVKFPSSLKRINWCAFYRTDGLVDVNLPEGLEYLGSSSFAQCNNLKSVSIPSSVSDIPYSPFDGSPELRRITVAPDNAKFLSLWNFLYSKDMKKLYQATPVSVSVTVMEGTEEVMEMAAWGCKRMKRLHLPSTLHTVRDLAFAFCDSLTDVRIDATVPPRFSSDRCFRGVAERDDCTLYVPVGCLEAYRNSAWDIFSNIEEYDPGSVLFLPQYLYLCGDFNSWKCPLYDMDSPFVLKRGGIDATLYSGIFDIPAGSLDFKVFVRPTDWLDEYGYWGADGMTESGDNYVFNIGAGVGFENISVSGWQGGKVEIIVDLRQRTLTVTPLTEVETASFVETVEIKSGARYVIACDNRVARPLQGAASYGYLSAATALSAEDGVCVTDIKNAFTISENRDAFYTIMGSDGLYYYMTGNYNNFNRDTMFPEDGGLWHISFNESGEAVILNVYNNKTFVYSTDYHNFAAYSALHSGDWLPRLYMLDSDMSVESIGNDGDMDATPEYYSLQGQRVMNPSKGIYIRRQGGKTSKVMIGY